MAGPASGMVGRTHKGFYESRLVKGTWTLGQGAHPVLRRNERNDRSNEGIVRLDSREFTATSMCYLLGSSGRPQWLFLSLSLARCCFCISCMFALA